MSRLKSHSISRSNIYGSINSLQLHKNFWHVKNYCLQDVNTMDGDWLGHPNTKNHQVISQDSKVSLTLPTSYEDYDLLPKSYGTVYMYDLFLCRDYSFNSKKTSPEWTLLYLFQTYVESWRNWSITYNLIFKNCELLNPVISTKTLIPHILI